jgi:hypothetical protein
MHVHLGGVYGGCEQGFASFVDKWGDFMNETLDEEYLTSVGLDYKDFTGKWGFTAQRRYHFY